MRIYPVSTVNQALNRKNPCIKKSECEPTTQPDTCPTCFRGLYQNIKTNVPYNEAKGLINDVSSTTFGSFQLNFKPNDLKLATLGIAETVKSIARENKKRPFALLGGDFGDKTLETIPYFKEMLMDQNINVMEVINPLLPAKFEQITKSNAPDMAIYIQSGYIPNSPGYCSVYLGDGKYASNKIMNKIAQNIDDIAKAGIYSIQLDSKATYFKLYN